jgi:hypothetical protein
VEQAVGSLAAPQRLQVDGAVADVRQAGQHEGGQHHQRDGDDDRVGPVGPAHAVGDHHGQQGDGSQRQAGAGGLTAAAGRRQRVAGEAQRCGGGRGRLGDEEGPAGDQAEATVQVAIAVLVAAAADRVGGGQLRARQPVEQRDHRGQADRRQHPRTGHAGGNADADEDAGAQDRAQAHQHRSGDADDPLELASHDNAG